MENRTHVPLTVRQYIVRQTTTYLVVCAFLTFANCSASPGHFWVKWVWAGWGLHLILSCLYYWQDHTKDRNS